MMTGVIIMSTTSGAQNQHISLAPSLG